MPASVCWRGGVQSVDRFLSMRQRTILAVLSMVTPAWTVFVAVETFPNVFVFAVRARSEGRAFLRARRVISSAYGRKLASVVIAIHKQHP